MRLCPVSVVIYSVYSTCNGYGIVFISFGIYFFWNAGPSLLTSCDVQVFHIRGGCQRARMRPTSTAYISAACTTISHAPRASIYGFLARIRFYHGTPALVSSLQGCSTELTYSQYHTICSLIRLVFITIYLCLLLDHDRRRLDF